ncbi:MAG: hypothetical protein H6704_05450 [Myxococcales bacterium]|nr:hypothetical protein [Myxococcales bacterium]MCB9535694.1 hypothetical protein [Myxococcales bacterium]
MRYLPPHSASAPPADPRDPTALVLGEWRDEDQDEIHIGRTDDGGFSVMVVDTTDGEVFDVRRVRWCDGELSWHVRIPSTGVELFYRTLRIRPDGLLVAWRNTAAGTDAAHLRGLQLRGTEELVRPDPFG